MGKHEGFRTEVVRVGPALATEYMKRNCVNRPLSRDYLKMLSSDMRAGRWVFNGETIIFAADGSLIDGQHRLTAIIMSGVELDLLVAFGISDQAEAFKTINSGRVRKIADGLAVAGHKNTSALSGAMRWQFHYQHDKIGAKAIPTRQDLYDILEANPRLGHFVALANPLRKIGLAQSLGGFLFYAFELTNRSYAQRFYGDLLTGEMLAKDDVTLQLRNRLIQNLGAMSKLPPSFIFALTVKAFNFQSNGVAVKNLRFSGNEEYPRISGCPLNVKI